MNTQKNQWRIEKMRISGESWWDSSWHYRVPLEITPPIFPINDEPVELHTDLQKLMSG